jgi:sugar phosphate isomerase/epimerase
MPTFGLCTAIKDAKVLADAGFDYVEPSVQQYLRGETADDDYEREASDVLPAPACNMLVPGHLKVTGPERDASKLETYMERVLRRAGEAKVETLVFGSGAARMIPDGFDRDEARSQILGFLRLIGPIAQRHGVVVVIEPLNRGECNVLNGVAESMTYVREVDHPHVKCLVDSYHHWLEKEPIGDIADAGGDIAHVHVADEHGRRVPGKGTAPNPASYEDFFRPLKHNGYDGRISIEGNWQQDAEALGEALDLIRRAWDAA